jgi:hypothetical protein
MDKNVTSITHSTFRSDFKNIYDKVIKKIVHDLKIVMHTVAVQII